MVQGILLGIERNSFDDGPGLRTVVFIKGCPLRCLWCSTPDGQCISPEMEHFVDKCIKCKKCVGVCPTKAIRVLSTEEITTNRSYCNSCGKCAEVCPSGARKIAGVKITVREVLDEIKKDLLFYLYSAGGVTLSGGEPLMQPRFSIEIIKACKKEGIHIAIETCAHTKWNILEQILRHTDLVYFDIKAMQNSLHKKFTRKWNRLILENIVTASNKFPNLPFVIRIPVIPGYNDSDRNMVSTAKFISKLNNVKRIELLPYHRLGLAKYRSLEKEYELWDLEPPSDEHMHHLEEMMKSYVSSIEAQIGGR